MRGVETSRERFWLFVMTSKGQATAKMVQMGDAGASAARHSARVKDMVACHTVVGLGRRDRVGVPSLEGEMVERFEDSTNLALNPCAEPPTCSRIFFVVNK